MALSRVCSLRDVVVHGYDAEEEKKNVKEKEKDMGRRRVWRYGQEGKVISFYKQVESNK